MILVMPSSSSLSRYSTTGFAESLSLVSPAPCRVNFVDEFHLGASDCLLHPVLADLHDLQDRLRRWRERRRVAQLNCPLLDLVAGSGLSARGTGNCGSATMREDEVTWYCEQPTASPPEWARVLWVTTGTHPCDAPHPGRKMEDIRAPALTYTVCVGVHVVARGRVWWRFFYCSLGSSARSIFHFYLGFSRYCVCCLSIATRQSGDDIHDFSCCHLRC